MQSTVAIVKYKVTAADGSTKYVLAKVTIPLPNMTALPEAKVVQKNIPSDSSMIFDDWYIISSPQCEPVQPEPEAPVAAVARPPTAEEKEILDSESVQTLVQDVSCD